MMNLRSYYNSGLRSRMTKKMYLSLAQVYLEVACEVVYLSKKDNELNMHSYKLDDDYYKLSSQIRSKAVVSSK